MSNDNHRVPQHATTWRIDTGMSAERQTVLVTGGAGFIGSTLVRSLLTGSDYDVVTLDKLTYAGNLDSLSPLLSHPSHRFVHGDIGDAALVRALLERHRPVGIMHLAAESHVDRSIDVPADFLLTNVMGTFTLLTEARRFWEQQRVSGHPFRFIHVSTDEVFGSLGPDGHFAPDSAYDPSSPYSATKAASDHLVRAWGRTYGLPVIVTNCSNNYGPHQFPEKLIPLIILSALIDRPLPVYGAGTNVRDWLYVDDHAAALRAAFERGEPGETYLFGGRAERTNLEVVQAICDLVDARLGRSGTQSTRHRIEFVADRPGHDFRYAIDPSKAERALGWRAEVAFEEGLARTVEWYLANDEWCERVRTGAYRLERAGLGSPA